MYSLLLRCAPCQEGYGALIKLQGEYVLRGGVYQSPELKGVNPEDYPDIHKLAILADVAPYSREYNLFRQKVGKEAQGNTELQIEYEKILNRVKQTRDSVIRMENRRFTAPVEEVEGTVESVSPAGVTLKEYPGLSVLPGTRNLARGRGRAPSGDKMLISGVSARSSTAFISKRNRANEGGVTEPHNLDRLRDMEREGKCLFPT